MRNRRKERTQGLGEKRERKGSALDKENDLLSLMVCTLVVTIYDRDESFRLRLWSSVNRLIRAVRLAGRLVILWLKELELSCPPAVACTLRVSLPASPAVGFLASGSVSPLRLLAGCFTKSVF